MPVTSIRGNVAHDAAIDNSPVGIGSKAINVMPTSVTASGDLTHLHATMHGALTVKPYAIPEADWQFACASAIAVTTDTAIKAAMANIRNYMTCFTFINTGTVATEIVIKDGATVIWRGYAPANMVNMIDVQLPTPLRGSVNTALNFACITAVANVYFNAQGYQAV